MNPDIAIPVLVAVLFLAATLAFVVLDRREERKYEPRHHHPAGPRHAFADDRDVTDPDGEQFVDDLHHDWWAEPAPGGKIEVLMPLSAGTRRLPMLTEEECDQIAAAFAEKFERDAKRDDPPEAPALSPASAETGEIPFAVGTWNGKTAEELAAELASKYLTAEVAQ